MTQLTILNPLAMTTVRKTRMAARLADLADKKIALYWNGKSGGDTALKALGEQLEKMYSGLKAELIYSALPGPKEKVEAAKTYAAVIASTAD